MISPHGTYCSPGMTPARQGWERHWWSGVSGVAEGSPASPGRCQHPSAMPVFSQQGKSPPADDKLVTQLCRAVKATFNPAQDACTVQLAPIQKSQVVAIKKITIQSELRARGPRPVWVGTEPQV